MALRKNVCWLWMLGILASLPFVAAGQTEDANLNEFSAGVALGGADVFAIIKGADKVTAQRVDSQKPKPGSEPEMPREIEELGKPFEITAADSARIKEILGLSQTYLSPSKRCQFRANVRYGFTRGPDTIFLVLCFGCGEYEVWRKGELIAYGPFDGGYGGLLEVTKKLFPDDRFFDKFSEAIFKERMTRALEGDEKPPDQR